MFIPELPNMPSNPGNPLLYLMEFILSFVLLILSLVIGEIDSIANWIKYVLQCGAALGAILLAVKGVLEYFGIKYIPKKKKED